MTMTELTVYEIERLEAQVEEAEKIANASLHQRKELMDERDLYRDALLDIEELVDGAADVDDGRPNLAMRVLVAVRLALRKEP